MGLDTTHDCWSGPYSQFHRWRIWLAEQIGLPLGLMDGFVESVPDRDTCDAVWSHFTSREVPYGEISCIWKTVVAASTGVPISWDAINDPLKVLLMHSDCDGKIRWWQCKAIAIRLGQIHRQSKGRDREHDREEKVERGCYDGMRAATKRFALGCLRAYRAKEDVRFA